MILCCYSNIVSLRVRAHCVCVWVIECIWKWIANGASLLVTIFNGLFHALNYEYVKKETIFWNSMSFVTSFDPVGNWKWFCSGNERKKYVIYHHFFCFVRYKFVSHAQCLGYVQVQDICQTAQNKMQKEQAINKFHADTFVLINENASVYRSNTYARIGISYL